ncbi:hypothetical protein FLONG3_1102 [Fusarium longipes]|uniref:Uncharacterized protein n=1 Tax=Fusarium longipes TaxID=694270 RepID=A0A395T8X6_9HYPO|nr:hypothetical protein FLONG3_1102 [Fusarium longipes]
MQFKNTIIAIGLLVSACTAAAVPEAQPEFPTLNLAKRACNEDGYRKCTQTCPGLGGAAIGCPIDLESQNNTENSTSRPSSEALPDLDSQNNAETSTSEPSSEARPDSQDRTRHDKTVDPVSKDRSKTVPDLQERAGQCIFLCLQSPSRGGYAVLVPCFRPTMTRRIGRRSKHGSGKWEWMYAKAPWWDRAYESDCLTYQRLMDSYYRQLNWWIRWVPYCGMIKVIEVNFQFDCTINPDGHYPISMKHLGIEDINEECERIMARRLEVPESDICNDYGGYREHSDHCNVLTEVLHQQCIKDQVKVIQTKAKEAEKRQKQLEFLSDFEKCARDPMRANELHILEGRAQESPVYDIK